MELYVRSTIWGITDHFWLKNGFAITQNVKCVPYFTLWRCRKKYEKLRNNEVHRAGLILDIGEGSAPNLRHFPGCRRVPGTCQSGIREDFFFFIFSIVFNTFIKKGKNEYIFKENPKKKVGALLKICNLRYYRSFLTEKWLYYNQKCKKKSLFLSHKLTCFQLEMP